MSNFNLGPQKSGEKLVSIPYGEGIISFKMTEKYTNGTFHFQSERYSLTIRWWKRWGLQMRFIGLPFE